jgi:hypothetical protein
MNKKAVEKIFEKAVWRITKYASEADKAAGKVLERVRIDGNALVNEGINELLTILGSAASGTKFDNTNAYLIVGTGSGAADPADTEATFTAGVKKAMEGGYPTYGTDQKITFKSSYGASDANQAWGEFGVLNAASSGKLLNRKVSDQGTKTSGQVWELELEITLS